MKKFLVTILVALMLALTGCDGGLSYGDAYMDMSQVPQYSGQAYVQINGNEPDFTEEDFQRGEFEEYSELDYLGRCGQAFALITLDTMPCEERQSISEIRPSGWHTVRYDDLIEDKYLYNRSHLIAFSLAGENANEKNLITGTRYMNQESMLDFEEEVLYYVRSTGNSVLYRVTPIFEGENLLATGVQMEAYSVEDDGQGVCFNVFVYNVQPGIEIDYETGDSWREAAVYQSEEGEYVLNTNSKKFHNINCSSVKDISEHNKKEFSGSRSELVSMGYEPCGSCNP